MRNDLALLPPHPIGLMEGNMVALSQELPDVRGRTIRVNAPSLIEQLVDGSFVAKNDDVRGPEFEREDRAILFGPSLYPAQIGQ